MKMPERDNEHLRKLFIGGLTFNTSDEQLRDFYAQWGEVVDHIVMKDPTTKRSRGFGFITYSDPEMLEEAMRNRPHVLDGREVDPKRAVPREAMNQGATGGGRSDQTKRLFVSGIRDDHTDEMLTDYFGGFGVVTKVEIISDRNTGQRRGFAFVNFDDFDPVDKCVQQRSHMIGGHRCDVKKAENRDAIRTPQQDRDRAGRTSSRGGRGGGRDDAWGRAGGGYQSGGWNQGGMQSWNWNQPAASQYAGYAPGYAGGYSAPYGQGYPQAQQTGGYAYPQAQPQWAAQPMPQQAGGWQAPPSGGAYPGYGGMQGGGYPSNP